MNMFINANYYNYYSWQYVDKTGSGFDGYTSAKSKSIDCIPISP